ncbi:unnamed protein product [Lactuca virosa]|uniref:Uncharacterized protein n=1 Tax=Lactuca virosa TaxID=75947 RepID=A0AAU9PVU2_9ASTR|nr:unnamed protein product [Lactuca virosa]
MLRVSYLIYEYKCDCTPNPDVLCNTRFKFGAFMDAISNMDFEFVASGHYAKVIHPLTDETNELSFLQLSKDMVCCSERCKKIIWFLYQEIITLLIKEGDHFVLDPLWINGYPPHNLNHLRCKVRHGPVFYDCSLHIEEKDVIGTVQLPEGDQGRSWPICSFLSKELCVGSGVGKEEKLDKFELPAKINCCQIKTPEFALVTATLKLKREQLKAKFKDDMQKLYE